MAQGTVVVFDFALVRAGQTGWDWNTDTFNLGIVDNTTTPTRDTADPRWAAGGTTNFLNNQVATGTSYTGPVTLVTPSWSETSDKIIFTFADPSQWAQDAGGGFTDGYYAVVYNDTDVNKTCVLTIELGGPINLQAGPLDIALGANGAFYLT